MFDDMKARMEKFGKDVEKSMGVKPKTGPGHTLGGATEAGDLFVFRSDAPLGMTLTKGEDLRAHVASIVPGGQAEAKGVKAGYVVESLDGSPLGYDSFMDAFSRAKAGGKAIKVGFRRVLPRAGGGASSSSASSSVFGAARKQKPISTGERDARRDAALRAAEARDAKFKGPGKKAPRKGTDLDAPRPEATGPRSAEAQAAWDRAKRSDEKTKRDLGYDPFSAVSTTGTLASERAQFAAAAPAPFSGGGRRLDGGASDEPPRDAAAAEVAAADDDDAATTPREDEAAAYDHVAAEVAMAVDAIVAFGTVDAAAATACLETLGKLLENAETKADPKFKKVRLGNKAIQQKILAVEGGLEAFVAAGFMLKEDNDETVLVLPDAFDRTRLRAVADALQVAKARLAP